MSLDDQVSSIKGHKLRAWTIEEMWRTVEESLEPGVSIARVARRYHLNANQLCTWRLSGWAMVEYYAYGGEYVILTSS